MFDGVVHGGLHPAPGGVQVVGRRPQRLLLQRRHGVVVAPHPGVVVQCRLLQGQSIRELLPFTLGTLITEWSIWSDSWV